MKRVCDGYNFDGTKRIRSRTLRKPFGMSDAKFQKFAQEETLKDEMRYKEGYELDKRKTFAEYAAYVMDCKASSGHWNAMQACSGESMPESEQ